MTLLGLYGAFSLYFAAYYAISCGLRRRKLHIPAAVALLLLWPVVIPIAICCGAWIERHAPKDPVDAFQLVGLNRDGTPTSEALEHSRWMDEVFPKRHTERRP